MNLIDVRLRPERAKTIYMSTNYGWTFDKAGNKVKVSAPITSNGKKVKKPSTTLTGSIPANVGFHSMNDEIISKKDADILNSLYDTMSI